jgi:Na+-driven multidrug efflux pump
VPAAFSIICSVLFQGIGHGMYSLMVSLARQLIGLLPLAFVLSAFWGITGVWWAFPAAEFIGMAASGILIYRTYVREIASLESESSRTRS